MWILRLQNPKENEENAKKIWYIWEKSKKYTVGRRQDNQDQPNVITLIGDKSVSREHAIIHLDSDDQLHVEDLSSRYGTFYFSKDGSIEQLPARDKKLLSCGDVLRFGALNNLWKINQISFATCASTCKLTNETLAMLKCMHVSTFPQWTDDCTHLTMYSITLTLKVLSALVAARPIVKPEFWEDCYYSIQNNFELPNPQDYLPSVQEPTLDQQTANFLVDPLRKRVFLDKTFFFFTKSQMDKYKNIIESASGTADLLRFSKMKRSEKLCSPDCIVVQCMNEELSQDTQSIKVAFDEIVQHLNKNNFRVIPEAEIGLAILSNSLQKFCNPKFSFVEEILKSPPSRASNEDRNVEIFALETEPYAMSHQGSSKSFAPIISPFSNKSENKNQNSSVETSNTNSTTECKEVKQNRKMLRNLSPESDEPPTKKMASNLRLNVPKFTNKTREPDPNEEMFNFENDSTKSKTEFNSTLNVKLNVKLNVNKKKKHVDAFIPDEDNNLFDFLPSESQETNKRCKKTKIISIDNEKPNNKRICLEKDSILDRNTLSSFKIDGTNSNTSLQSKLENIRWTSSKNPSLTSQIKEENVEKENKTTDEIDGKMETLCLKPAIVIVNNNLIKREKLVDKTYNSSGEMKTNFKKFSKIQPLKPQSEIIPRSKFFIYEIEAPNSSRKMKGNIIPDEEEEYDFSLLDRNIRNSNNKTTSRRRM